MDPIIETENVVKHFGGEPGITDTLLGREPSPVRAVDGVTLSVQEGSILGIAGESGCGKTTLGEMLVKLLEPTRGEVHFDGQPYSSMDAGQQSEFRRRVQMIFQDPYESLNPRYTVLDTVAEPLKINDIGSSFADREQRVRDTLADVGLQPVDEFLDKFPGELSGGEQQRVAIARALVIEPDLVVADEPVSMLDVSLQANVLKLLKRLQDDYDLTYVIISHDLSLLQYMCDQLAIMYLGEVVEQGATSAILDNPKHPYSRALINSVPVTDPDYDRQRTNLEGELPSARNPPSGCKFHPRCPEYIGEVCERKDPDTHVFDADQEAACHLYREDEG